MNEAENGLTIRVEDTGDNECCVYLNGSLDLDTCGQLETAMKEQLKRGIRLVKLDLAELNYISSAGFGIFIQETQEFKAENGNILFVNPSQKARDMFELLGVLIENCRFNS